MPGDPWIGRPWSRRPPNRVNERRSILAETGRNLVEIFAVMRHTDMFKHTNRDNLVILAGKVAIILNLKIDTVAEPGGLSALLSQTVLLTG